MGDDASVAKRVEQAVGTVATYLADGTELGQGTAFAVADGVFITNVHVLLGASRASLWLQDTLHVGVDSVLAWDAEADLAIFKAPVSPRHTLRYAKREPLPGEPVLVIGSPLGLDYSVSTGVVAAVRTVAGVKGVLQLTAPVSSGSSGSPVVNSRGRVVGVVTSQIENAQNVNFAAPASRLLAMRTDDPGVPLARWSKETTTALLDSADRLLILSRDVAGPTYSHLNRTPEDRAQARRFYRMVQAADSGSWRAWAGLGWLTMLEVMEANEMATRSMEYVAFFHRAVEYNPRFLEGYLEIDHALLLRMASGASFQHLVNAQLANAQRAVRHVPNDARAWAMLGGAYEGLGRESSAEGAYLSALNIDLNHTEVLGKLGFFYTRTGQRQAALRIAQRLRNLGDICGANMVLGDYDCVVSRAR